MNQLQFVIIVKNLTIHNRKKENKKYIDILIQLLRIRNKITINFIHNLMKIEI